MKSKLLFITLLFVTFISCKKPGNDPSNSTTTVKYQVTSTNTTGQFVAAYNNMAAQYISGLYQSGWETSFTPSNKPFTATLNVSPYNATMTVTLKIFVNNSVVKEVTGQISNTTGTMQNIQYVVN
jgi:hypothetical protein